MKPIYQEKGKSNMNLILASFFHFIVERSLSALSYEEMMRGGRATQPPPYFC
jgi:hypothetical protein